MDVFLQRNYLLISAAVALGFLTTSLLVPGRVPWYISALVAPVYSLVAVRLVISLLAVRTPVFRYSLAIVSPILLSLGFAMIVRSLLSY